MLGERDLVCRLEEILRDGGHDHLCIGFGDAKVAAPVQTKEPLYCAKIRLGPETALWDQLVESLLRLAWRSVRGDFAQNIVSIFLFQCSSVYFVGVGFVGQGALRIGPLNHRAKLWAFTKIGGCDMYFIDKAIFICARKSLIAQQAL